MTIQCGIYHVVASSGSFLSECSSGRATGASRKEEIHRGLSRGSAQLGLLGE